MIKLPITKVDKLLGLDESILSVTVVNMKGQIVYYNMTTANIKFPIG